MAAGSEADLAEGVGGEAGSAGGRGDTAVGSVGFAKVGVAVLAGDVGEADMVEMMRL